MSFSSLWQLVKLYCLERYCLLRAEPEIFIFTSWTLNIPEWLERVGSNTLYIFKGSRLGIDDLSLSFIINEDLINIFGIDERLFDFQVEPCINWHFLGFPAYVSITIQCTADQNLVWLFVQVNSWDSATLWESLWIDTFYNETDNVWPPIICIFL